MFMKSLLRTALLALLVLFCCNAQVRFNPPTIQNNKTTISLAGIPETNTIFLESSANLTDWSFLFSGQPDNNGALIFSDPRDNTTRQFYRAIASNLPPPPIALIPTADTNQTISTLITTNGGSCLLSLENGGLITLTFPPNTVLNPTLVAMTRVTNLSGLPFSRGMLAAVQIQPTNAVFFGAATLEITFPTNAPLDRREVISFKSANNGLGFALTPDRVTQKSTTLPIINLGLFGSALATAQEFSDLKRSVAASPAATKKTPRQSNPPPAEPSRFFNASLHCFPERVQEAQAIETQLQLSLGSLSSSIELMRAEGRRNQQSTELDDPQIDSDLACAFYNDEIKPLFPQVGENCSLLHVLAGATLSLARQWQLLGYTNCPGLENLSELPVCAGARACLDEIKQCCELDLRNRNLYRQDLLSLLRTEQLLGLENSAGCVSPSEISQQLQACSDLAWNGFVVVTETANYFQANDESSYTHELESSYSGAVTDAVDIGGIAALLTLRGELASKDLAITVINNECIFPRCGAAYDISQSTAQGPHAGFANLTFSGTGANATYSLTISSGGAPYAPAMSLFKTTSYVCETCRLVTTYLTNSLPSGGRFESLSQFTARLTDTNMVVGSASVTNSFAPNVDRIANFHWRFTRSPSPSP